MGIIATFSKYAWIPYLFLCMGLMVLFGTEEWLLFHYRSPNELVVDESKFAANQPLEIFRRALNELDEDEINMLYSAAIQAAQTRAVTANTEPIRSLENAPQTTPRADLEAFQNGEISGKVKFFKPRPESASKKLTFEPEPLEDVKPVQQEKPVQKEKPVEQKKPVEQEKPVQQKTTRAPAADADGVVKHGSSRNGAIEMIKTGQKKKIELSPLMMNAKKSAIVDGVYTNAIVTDVHSATVEELKKTMPSLDAPPVNRNFVFHNKIPKAGSTTMKWLLVGLAKRNQFTLDHQRWCIDTEHCVGRDPKTHRQIDGPDGEEKIAEYVPEKIKQLDGGKYLLLKHHHWFNFTDHGVEMPTYINIARDPVTRFASWYYFERFGWQRSEGQRAKYSMNNGEEADDRDMTLDECVATGHSECLEPVQVLVKYFCGTVKTCSMMDKATGGHSWRQVAVATERAKAIIAKYFHVVGVLEHFDQTLELFEKMLPEYFQGAREVYKTPELQKQRESTKSSHQKASNETRYALETGVLRYEVDIYKLIKSLFYEKLHHFGIPMPETV